jgi:beta-glucanase (GH16 family)
MKFFHLGCALWMAGCATTKDESRLLDEPESRRIEAESCDAKADVDMLGRTYAGYFDEGDWMMFRAVDFRDCSGLKLRIAGMESGGIAEMRTGSLNGPIIGVLNMKGTGGWEKFADVTVPVRASGIHDLYFVGTKGRGIFNLDWFEPVPCEEEETPVWADEFNYSGPPDTEKWEYEVGGHGWGNEEKQFYTENRRRNARVEGGVLVIEAHREDYDRNRYTSARLRSREKGDWTYGRFDVRAKIPSGRGSWPAIWMLPTDWEYGGWPDSGEIDIMEHVGFNPGVVHGTVHTKAYNHMKKTARGCAVDVPSFDERFHVYSVRWSPEDIHWYVDGREYCSFANEHKGWWEWPFDKRFHFLLNIAVGGTWGGQQGIDDGIFPIRMEIDYVRVYGR